MQATGTIAVLLAALSLGACSHELAYVIGQRWQVNECGKLVDSQERERCLERASMSYETYRKQTDAGKGGQ